jgi:hypothetical protein
MERCGRGVHLFYRDETFSENQSFRNVFAETDRGIQSRNLLSSICGNFLFLSFFSPGKAFFRLKSE